MNCKQCGDCCRILSTIILTDKEISSARFQTAKKKLDGETRLKKSTKGYCIYLQNNRCKIHDIKPRVCQSASCPKQEGYLGFAKEDS